eukprot:1158386-Pelagomonas_calceolata.AAC.5
MAESEKAPDLQLDEKSQQGFINWYRGLPQVGDNCCLLLASPSFCLYPLVCLLTTARNMDTKCLHHMLPAQEGQKIRVFDRKVGPGQLDRWTDGFWVHTHTAPQPCLQCSGQQLLGEAQTGKSESSGLQRC